MTFAANLGIIAGIALGIQWVVFIPSAIFKSERFYDLTGSLTILFLTSTSLDVAGASTCPRTIIASSLVAVWALRLGLSLFIRILHVGEDKRFKEARENPKVFFVFWSLQSVWTFLAGLCVYVSNLSRARCDVALGPAEYVGIAAWAIGWLAEVVADRQKANFRANPANKGKWIDCGLWSFSRHPNYVGEITLWVGLATFCGCGCEFWWQILMCAISPAFSAFLLLRVSGVPLQEIEAHRRWGTNPEYLAYLARTPCMFLIGKGVHSSVMDTAAAGERPPMEYGIVTP